MIAAAPDAPRVLLVGMMGAGKTTVGNELARVTGWPYLDNDDLVLRIAGTPTAELLRSAGAAALRRTESAALAEALRLPPPVVAGVAGGVVDDPADRVRLAGGGFVVWLRAAMATLTHRVRHGGPRPWLPSDPERALRQLYRGRARWYRQVAALVVDVDRLTPGQVASRILAALPPGHRSPGSSVQPAGDSPIGP